MKRLRIGYWPLSSNLQATGDRRRFVHWAKAHNHVIIPESYENCDLVVFTAAHDPRIIDFVPNNIPKILDLPDHYLVEENVVKDIARTLIKNSYKMRLSNFKKFSSLISQIERDNLHIVCSSPEQVISYRNIGFRTSPILDFHEEFPNLNFLPKIGKSSKCNLLWEGQSANLKSISEFLAQASNFLNHECHIHFVTDDYKFKFANKYFKSSTFEFLNKKIRGNFFHFDFKTWSIPNVIAQAKQSTLFIVPVDQSSPIGRMKPENRILISWRLGLPVLADKTPAHKRLEDNLQLRFSYPQSEWLPAISAFSQDIEVSEEQVDKGKKYLDQFHNEEILIEKWDNVVRELM